MIFYFFYYMFCLVALTTAFSKLPKAATGALEMKSKKREHRTLTFCVELKLVSKVIGKVGMELASLISFDTHVTQY